MSSNVASGDSLCLSSLVSTTGESSDSTMDATSSNSCGNIAEREKMFGHLGLHFVGTSLQKKVDIAEANNLVSEKINTDGKASEECKNYDLTVSEDFSSLSSDGFSSPNSFFTASDESLSPSSLVSAAEKSSNSMDVIASNDCGNIAAKQRMFEHLVSCYYAVHFICFEIVEVEDSLFSVLDQKAVKFFVDILKSSATFDNNLKYLVGKLDQADADVLQLIKQSYQGDKIKDFFIKHKVFDFSLADMSVKLSVDYEIQLENIAKMPKSFIESKLDYESLCSSSWGQLCASTFEGLLRLTKFLQHKKKASLSCLCNQVSTIPSFLDCLNRFNWTDPSEKLGMFLKGFKFFIPVGENDYSLSNEVKSDVFLSTLEKFSRGLSKENHSKLMLSTHDEYLSENCSTESFSKQDDLKVEIVELVECFLHDVAYISYSELPQVLGAYLMHRALHLSLWSYDIIWILLNSGLLVVGNGQVGLKDGNKANVLSGKTLQSSTKILIDPWSVKNERRVSDVCEAPKKNENDNSYESEFGAIKLSVKCKSETDHDVESFLGKIKEERDPSDPNVCIDSFKEKNISVDHEKSPVSSTKIPLINILRKEVKLSGDNKPAPDTKVGFFHIKDELEIMNSAEIQKILLNENVSKHLLSPAVTASKELSADSLDETALNSFEKTEITLNVPKLSKKYPPSTKKLCLLQSFELLMHCYYSAHFLCLEVFEETGYQSISLEYRAINFFVDLLKPASGAPCKGNLKSLQRKLSKADADVCEMIRSQYSGFRISTFFLEHKVFDFNSSDLSVTLSEGFQRHLTKIAELSSCSVKSKQYFEIVCNSAWTRHCACIFAGLINLATLLVMKGKLILDEVSKCLASNTRPPFVSNLDGICRDKRCPSKKLKKLLNTFEMFKLVEEKYFYLSDKVRNVNCSSLFDYLPRWVNAFCEEKQKLLLKIAHAEHFSDCSPEGFLKYDDFCIKVVEHVSFLLQEMDSLNYSHLPQMLGSYIMHSAFHLGFGCSDVMGILYDSGLFEVGNGQISRKKNCKPSISNETVSKYFDEIPIKPEAIKVENNCLVSENKKSNETETFSKAEYLPGKDEEEPPTLGLHDAANFNLKHVDVKAVDTSFLTGSWTESRSCSEISTTDAHICTTESFAETMKPISYNSFTDFPNSCPEINYGKVRDLPTLIDASDSSDDEIGCEDEELNALAFSVDFFEQEFATVSAIGTKRGCEDEESIALTSKNVREQDFDIIGASDMLGCEDEESNTFASKDVCEQDFESVGASDMLACEDEESNTLASNDVSEQEFDIFKFALDVEKGVFDDYLEKNILAEIEDSYVSSEKASSVSFDENKSETDHLELPIQNCSTQKTTSSINSFTGKDFNDCPDETSSVTVKGRIKDDQQKIRYPKSQQKAHRNDSILCINNSTGSEDLNGSCENCSVTVNEGRTKANQSDLFCPKSLPKTHKKDATSSINNLTEKECFNDCFKETFSATINEGKIKDDQADPYGLDSSNTIREESASNKGCDPSFQEPLTAKVMLMSSDACVAEYYINEEKKLIFCLKHTYHCDEHNDHCFKSLNVGDTLWCYVNCVCLDCNSRDVLFPYMFCRKRISVSCCDSSRRSPVNVPKHCLPMPPKRKLNSSQSCWKKLIAVSPHKPAFEYERRSSNSNTELPSKNKESYPIGNVLTNSESFLANCPQKPACKYERRSSNSNTELPSKSRDSYPLNSVLSFLANYPQKPACKYEGRSSDHPTELPARNTDSYPPDSVLNNAESYSTNNVLDYPQKPSFNCAENYSSHTKSSGRTNEACVFDNKTSHSEYNDSFGVLACINCVESSQMFPVSIERDTISAQTEISVNSKSFHDTQDKEFNTIIPVHNSRIQTFSELLANQSQSKTPDVHQNALTSLLADCQTDVTGNIRPSKESSSSTCLTNLTGEVECSPHSVSTSCQTISQSISVIQSVLPPCRSLSFVKQCSISLDGPDVLNQSVQCGSSDDGKFKSSDQENSAAMCDATSQTLSTGSIIMMNYIP